MRTEWREFALLLLAVCAAYANSLSGSFHYDDFHSLVQNPHIRDWQNIPHYFIDPSLFSVDPAKAMYRPLLLVSYAFNHAVGGYEVWGYRIFNLAVHLACVVLLWRLAGQGSRMGGLCAGLIFALHPLASEPVNYISSRSESLAVALLLAGYVCYRRQDRLGAVLGPLVFAGALLVKSIAIVLPGLLMLSVFAVEQRRFYWRRHAPYWGLSVAYVALIVYNRFLGDSLARAPRGIGNQLLTQCKALVFYLKTLLVPVGLSVEPQFVASDTLDGAIIASAALIASVAYFSLSSKSTRFYGGWCLLALAPTLLIPLNVLVNEHRLYLPLAGLALGVGGWWRSIDQGRLLWPAVVCLLVWAGLTVQRNEEWRDELSLWTAAAKDGSQMPRVHVHLGNALRDGGRLPEARDAYQRALSFAPGNRPARTNLANLFYEAALADANQREIYLQRAIEQYSEVLKWDPDYREALNNLGSAHMMLGDYPRAEQVWRHALARHPHHPEAHYNMGLLQVRMARPQAAIAHYQQALVLTADAEIYRELGNALVGLGRLNEAAQAYREAIAMRSGEAVSQFNLAEVLLVIGEQQLAQGHQAKALEQWQGARRALQTVLKLEPGHPRAQRRLQQLKERLR